MNASIAQCGTGFGLGLRTAHYADFLAAPQPVDWLEIITDNYLVEGGKPLQVLDRLRRDVPMAMHGVAMSLGAASGLDRAYLARVKALADRVEPLWVSDHLCWIGPGPEQLHDLYPLPYTDEAARLVIDHIRQAQDALGRRLVIENVSSYLDYRASAHSEWQFLSHIANEADCLLLLDVNNVFVSSVNHGFDPLSYLRALPAHRIQQIHLAGHSPAREGDGLLIDTHDHPVAPEVWALYREARRLFGPVAAMIERDADIPPLPELLAELAVARRHAAEVDAQGAGVVPVTPAPPLEFGRQADAPDLGTTQRRVADHVLSEALPAERPDAAALLRAPAGADPLQRLGVYHHAYRARLAEVLADTFAKTARFMGDELFHAEATAFAPQHPPRARSLNRYSEAFVAHLAARYPHNPELAELAQLDWDLRTAFDGPDVPALDAAAAQADAEGVWLQRAAPLHPSVRLRPITTNVVSLWKAIEADEEVPPVVALSEPTWLLVWRQGLRPHFQTVDAGLAAFLSGLRAGASVTGACEVPEVLAWLDAPERLAGWLQGALGEGWLRGD
ncbi:MNIO family bufferin maturase [Inhella crocodyli]|uniref:UPF0276 protein EOD73_11535 n=1 Tax=Inhella crocodyli TaxID=2499851 RepID=A0A3S2XU57_9BURK|nr:DUF692 family multinuclear iron-containing protein [Inhella crocodyli]RVT84754.1 DUF692 family protein [Inhella crocodyli]